jgi:hypothetical protein
VIEDKRTFHCHSIHTFDFTAMDSKEKLTAYKFVKNVHDVWMPTHFQRLCSVVDALPADLQFELSQESELQESVLADWLKSRTYRVEPLKGFIWGTAGIPPSTRLASAAANNLLVQCNETAYVQASPLVPLRPPAFCAAECIISFPYHPQYTDMLLPKDSSPSPAIPHSPVPNITPSIGLVLLTFDGLELVMLVLRFIFLPSY